MKGIVIELTNRCNLKCLHCLDARHRADGDQKVETLQKVLGEAKALGFEHLSFTGGEPTLHREFGQVIKKTSEAGYKYGFVTNGWNFQKVFEYLLSYRDGFTAITFSLDGACEETHDRMRGRGSFRQVMKAVSICVVKDIPFTFNSIVTSANFRELDDTVDLAQRLGSRGVRFGHLLPGPQTMGTAMELSPPERREVDSTILELGKTSEMPVAMAPGRHTAELFPCLSLEMREFNVDWNGNVSLCCHLSGFEDNSTGKDAVGNLQSIALYEAVDRLAALVDKFRKDKLEHHRNGDFKDSDYFPCRYCLNYFEKLRWLNTVRCPDLEETPVHGGQGGL